MVRELRINRQGALNLEPSSFHGLSFHGMQSTWKQGQHIPNTRALRPGYVVGLPKDGLDSTPERQAQCSKNTSQETQIP